VPDLNHDAFMAQMRREFRWVRLYLYLGDDSPRPGSAGADCMSAVLTFFPD
jgi:hypothetical protein